MGTNYDTLSSSWTDIGLRMPSKIFLCGVRPCKGISLCETFFPQQPECPVNEWQPIGFKQETQLSVMHNFSCKCLNVSSDTLA